MAVKILVDVWLLIALAIHVCTIVFAVASVAGPYWMDGPVAHFGLWNYCYEYVSATHSDKCYQITDVDGFDVDGYFRGIQVFMCMGCIITLVTFLLIFGLIFMLVRQDNRKYALFVTVIVCFIQGMLLFTGCVMFLSQKEKYAGVQMSADWAHYLAWVACCCSFIAACFLVVHYALNREVYEEL